MNEINLNRIGSKPRLERNVSITIPMSTVVKSETPNVFKGLSLQMPTEEKKSYYDNSKDIQTLLELSDFRDKLSIGLRVYHSGWEEQDHFDKYYIYQKVYKNEISREDLLKIQELDYYNSGKHIFDLKMFKDSFLDKYHLISCVKEEYNNCQYKLFKRHYK